MPENQRQLSRSHFDRHGTIGNRWELEKARVSRRLYQMARPSRSLENVESVPTPIHKQE